jgi:hypothetical protein
MIIVNKTTLQVVSEQEFRSLHKNISFPAVLSSAALEGTDYEYITPQPAPNTSKYQSLVLGSPYKYQGKVRIKYEVVDNTPSTDAILKEYELTLDSLLKQKANEYKYDSVYTMISYRGDPNPKFASEAESMFIWRSKVYTKANELLQAFLSEESSNAQIPSIDQLISQLPDFELVE